jgi:hypothetical protein
MNKVFTKIKDWLFDTDSHRSYQLFNYVTVVVLSVIIKVFLLLMDIGEAFSTQFEICVWVFMLIFLVLRMMQTIKSLEGYYLLSSSLCLLYILIPGSSSWIISVAISFVIMCKTIELILLIKGIFAKEVEDVA